MWELVSFVAGMVVLFFLFQLLDMPELLANRLKKSVSRDELEERLADVERRLQELEGETSAS